GAPCGPIGTGAAPGGVSTGIGAGVASCVGRPVASGAVSTDGMSAGIAAIAPGAGDGTAAIAATDARPGIETDPPTVAVGATVGTGGIVGRAPMGGPPEARSGAALVRSPRNARR